MEKLDNILVKILYYICAFLMLQMAVVVTAQVISRYVFGSPFTWTEELGRYTFVWVSFLGMAVAIKHGSHIALDILVKKLNGVSKKALMLLNNALILVFAGVLTFSGWKLVELGSRQDSPSLGLPMEYVYLVMPVSGILLFYFMISETVLLFKGKGENV
ncbi:TRAP transporter small permease [Bacillus salacetis]|uniref:TRAP transporter small permease n=1 Tax=Bacillus salacetis TaxID=2315464 RepID=A0A3A1QRL3_9BACI|nr:TRAP transporter small permease [Bacillus salacetis]RIW29183.1 TRAP transporter small permease [Bacillus salacetis]